MDRALMHSDCSYNIPNVRVVGRLCKTNQASNTAFRGFGGPQVGVKGARVCVYACVRVCMCLCVFVS